MERSEQEHGFKHTPLRFVFTSRSKVTKPMFLTLQALGKGCVSGSGSDT